MGRPVVFVDTSVLCNLLRVPGKDSDHQRITTDLLKKRQSSDLVLPVTAIIETGNHIAQLANGHSRRTCAEKFAGVLQMVISGAAPWVLHAVEWDDAYLRAMLDGARTGSSLIALAMTGLGCGDLSILVEVERYRARTTGVEIEVWTLDNQLSSYC